MRSFHATTLFTGNVSNISSDYLSFEIKLLTNETITITTSSTTYYEVLRNIGDIDRDRVETKQSDIDQLVKRLEEKELEEKRNDAEKGKWKEKQEAVRDQRKSLLKYLYDKEGLLVSVFGVYSEDGDRKSCFAKRVVLMHSEADKYGWEETHWWVQQINTLFENWLDSLFQNKREFTESDIAEFYRTNLDLLGGETLDSIQECATLSRFLYGLSSSYMMTGNERSLSAAKACARYIINAYANPTHDGKYVLWKYGRVRDAKTTREIIPSQNPDDFGTYALYEQIYVLSGLAQYYRITQDTWVLSYITRTIAGFNRFFKDDTDNAVNENGSPDTCFTGKGGYFSHIDPVTMRPDSDFLGQNKMKKNWNSIGDHIPAYLVNLLLAIDPVPETGHDNEAWLELLSGCRSILEDCVVNILDHFPSKDEENSLFVNERFEYDWTPDHNWGWQKNRGIVGHNLKISWNLTRSAHYLAKLASESQDDTVRRDYEKLVRRCYELSKTLGENMKECGVDLIRGGIFDALERSPQNGMKTEFAWGATKDFWQQEQAILAYYIMQGVDSMGDDTRKDFLQLARYCTAFWSLFFVDQDYRKIYFRTNEIGSTVIEGQYGIQGGHAIAGYHAFELCYLAHIYIKSYVGRDKGAENFVLYYQPKANTGINTLNVLPDFFRPDDLRLASYTINGAKTVLEGQARYKFQIPIANIPENSVIIVEYERGKAVAKSFRKGLLMAENAPVFRRKREIPQIPFMK